MTSLLAQRIASLNTNVITCYTKVYWCGSFNAERIPVMTLNLHMETDELKEKIKDKMTYTFLDRYMIRPEISTYKLKLLQLLIQEMPISKKIQEKYIIATTFVQISLDIHERIPNNEYDEVKSKKLAKQLSVLGGDYYSSLHYVLLSEIGDIDFIQMMATTIKEINVTKMNAYYQHDQTIEDHLHLIQKIQAQIFVSIAIYLGITNHTTIRIIEQLILYEVLINEMERFKYNRPLVYDVFTNLNDLDKHIQEINQSLQNLFRKESSQFIQNLQNIYQQLRNHYKQIRKEGNIQ